MTPPIDSWDGKPEWLSAFEGIDYFPQAGTPLTFNSVVGPRLRWRVDTERVLIPIGTLFDIAKRIDSLSAALVEAQGGSAAALGEQELRSYQAQQEAAERAAAKVGVLVEDFNGDWSALYNAAGKRVETGHVSSVRDIVVRDSWTTTRIDAEGLLFDWGSGASPTPEDLQEFPPTLAELQRAMRKRAATTRDVEPEVTL